MTYVKHLVSKKKRRFIDDEFDLDLAYIKPNIVAMGFPSENLEGVYRNHVDDVHRFLEMKHKDNYKVYNLCSEKSYDHAKFGMRVSVYGFDDHNAPPFELIHPYCEDMDHWLKTPDHVAIVHCKAGKGRTGVMICSYLLYKQYFLSALDAMNYYADARTQNKKGVTIPSQRRYITYFGYFARNGYRYVKKTIILNSITLVGVPTIASGTCNPSLHIYQTKVILHKSKTMEVRKNQTEIEMDIGTNPIPICGDIKIDMFHKDLFKKERMLIFWFNTYFLELGVTLTHPDGDGVTELGEDEHGNRLIQYEISKINLDKANKDKKHRYSPATFKVRLNITIPRSTPLSDDVNAKRSSDSKDTPKESPNNKDRPLGNIVEERASKNLKPHTNDSSNSCSNNIKADPSSSSSRGYCRTDGRINPSNPNERTSTRPKHLAPKTSPETLGSFSKDLCISMETLQVEDAEHLSSSDDEDEEMLL